MRSHFKDSYWIRSGFISFSQKLSDILLGFGSFFFLVRVLSPADFGSWCLFISVGTIVELGKNGLIKNGLIKFTNSGDPSDNADIQGASLVLNFLATIAISLLIVLAANPLATLWGNPELEYLFFLLPAVLLLLIPYSHISFVQQAKMEFGSLFWSTFLRRGIFLLAVALIFIFRSDISLYKLILIQCVSLALSSLFSYFLVKKLLIIRFKNCKEWLKALFHYGKYVFGTNLTGYLASSVDQLMIGGMLNTTAVATYNVSVRVTNLVEVPSNSMSTILFPKSSQLSVADDRGKLRQIYEGSTGLILAILLPAIVFVLLLPDFVIWILAGDSYAGATEILKVTIMFALFIPFLRQAGTILDSIGKPKLNFHLTVLNLILTPALNFFFIRQFGLKGAAYGTLLSYVTVFFVSQVIMSRMLGVRVMNVVKSSFFFYQKVFVAIGIYGKKVLFGG